MFQGLDLNPNISSLQQCIMRPCKSVRCGVHGIPVSSFVKMRACETIGRMNISLEGMRLFVAQQGLTA